MQHKTNVTLLLLIATAVPAAAQCLHSFDAPRSLTFETSRPIAAADFDRDGRADLLTADAVYLGFSKRVSVSPSGPTAHVRINDVNRDGAADVVGVAGKELVVLVNKGDATFIRKTTPFTTSNPFPTFAWGDFNGDGLLDAFVHGSAGVYLAAGDGTFQQENGIVFSAAGEWLVADVTGDGRDDIIVVAGGGPIIIYRREANGFAGAMGPQLHGFPLLAADFDGDGRDDIVTSTSIIFDVGGSTHASETFSAPLSGTLFAAVDLNRDGALDLAATSSSPAKLRIYLNDGHGNLGIEQEMSGFATMPIFADLDGDAVVDLVTTERLHPVILRGNGDGTFRDVPRVALAAGQTGAAGDLDGDGDDDIAFPTAVAWNNGDNTFRAMPLQDDRMQRVLLAADVDGDGTAEVIASSPLGEIVVLHVGPDGELVEVARLKEFATDVAVGDFSGAHRAELAVLTPNSVRVIEIRSGAAPRFVAPLLGPSWSIAAADLNRDGADDLLVAGGTLIPGNAIIAPPAGSRDGFLSVLLSTGSSFEQERRTQYPSAALHRLVTGDFDGDGKTDAAATTMYVTPRMIAFFGEGQGAFARTQEALISSTFYPETDYHLRAADLNGDGRTDIAVNATARLFFGAPGGLTEGPARYFGPLVTEERLIVPPMLVRPRRGMLPSIIVPVVDGSDAFIYRPFCSRLRPVRR